MSISRRMMQPATVLALYLPVAILLHFIELQCLTLARQPPVQVRFLTTIHPSTMSDSHRIIMGAWFRLHGGISCHLLKGQLPHTLWCRRGLHSSLRRMSKHSHIPTLSAPILAYQATSLVSCSTTEIEGSAKDACWRAIEVLDETTFFEAQYKVIQRYNSDLLSN